MGWWGRVILWVSGLLCNERDNRRRRKKRGKDKTRERNSNTE